MQAKRLKNFVSALIVLSFSLFLSACTTTGGGVAIEVGKQAEHGHLPAEKKGPPPHAPAHGYRAKYLYQYYPACSVYYDTGRKIYFYIQKDNWRVSASLPNHLHVALGDFVMLEMDTHTPYTHHEAHKHKYPPGQSKKQHKKRKKAN